MKINKLNGYLLSLTITLSLYMGTGMAAETMNCTAEPGSAAKISASWNIDLGKTKNIMSVNISKDQTKLVDNLKPTGIIADSSTNFSHITWIYGSSTTSSKTSSKTFFWSLAYKGTTTGSNGEVETWKFYGLDGGANAYRSIKLSCKKTSPVKWSSMTYKNAVSLFHNDDVKLGVIAVRMSYGRCYPARNFSTNPEDLEFGWDWDNTTSRLTSTLGGRLQSSLDTESNKPIKSITVELKAQSITGAAKQYIATYINLVVTGPEWTAWKFTKNRDGVSTESLLLCYVSDTPFSDYISQGELLSREPIFLDGDDNGDEIPEEQTTIIHPQSSSNSGGSSSSSTGKK